MKRLVIYLVLIIFLITPIGFAKEVKIQELFQKENENFDVVSDDNALNSELGTISYFYAGSKLIASKDSNGLEYKYQDRLGSDIESRQLPFGQELVNSGNRFEFTGKELDDQSGLNYFNARYYDSNLGRFTSIDPVKDNHPYAYVANNPTNYVDPSGMDGNSVDLFTTANYPLHLMGDITTVVEALDLANSRVGLGSGARVSFGGWNFGGSIFNTGNAVRAGNLLGINPRLGSGFGGGRVYSGDFELYDGLVASISGRLSLSDSNWGVSGRGYDFSVGRSQDVNLAGERNLFAHAFVGLGYSNFQSTATARGNINGEGSVDISYDGESLYSAGFGVGHSFGAELNTHTSMFSLEAGLGPGIGFNMPHISGSIGEALSLITDGSRAQVSGGPLLQYSVGGVDRDVTLMGYRLPERLGFGRRIDKFSMGYWGELSVGNIFANIKGAGGNDVLNVGARIPF